MKTLNNNSNVVNELMTTIEALANEKGFGIKFSQTNNSNHKCTSRAYIFAIADSDNVFNCNSSAVIKKWEMNQSWTSGSTKNCERFRVLSKILNYIQNI